MRFRLLSTLLLAAVLLLTGCFASRTTRDTRHALERQFAGARLEHGVTLSLGPVSLLALRLIGSLASEEVRELRPYLRHVYRVEVTTYEAGRPLAAGTFDPMRLRALRRDGWQTAVTVREEDEAVWILYRARHGAIHDLYVLVLDQEEVALIRLRGSFDRLLRRDLADGEAGLLPEF